MLRATSCCLLILVLSSTAHAQYLINSPGDAGRSPSATFAICDTGNTVVNPNTGQSVTECTLRALIETVNELPAGSSSTVGFVDWIPTQGILPYTIISPQTPLPAIDRWLHLDGTTHPDYDPDGPFPFPKVVLDGAALSGLPPQSGNGLLITSGGSGTHIEAINVRHFPDAGIAIVSNNVRVSRSLIGVSQQGVNAAPNDLGIFINGNNNTIGQVAQAIGPPSTTPTTPARNVISGNQSGGV